MTRPLRRLVAAALVAGALSAAAPAADASIYCRSFTVDRYFFHVCL